MVNNFYIFRVMSKYNTYHIISNCIKQEIYLPKDRTKNIPNY